MDNSQIENTINEIRKRNGTVTAFDLDKISNAIFQALAATSKADRGVADKLAAEVFDKLVEQGFTSDKAPTVEDIQDIVESTLIDSGNSDIAKSYIVYRHERRKLRDEKMRVLNLKALDPVSKKFDLNCLRVLASRYLFRNSKSEIIETPTQMFERVAILVGIGDMLYDSQIFDKSANTTQDIDEAKSYLEKLDAFDYKFKVGDYFFNKWHFRSLINHYVTLANKGQMKVSFKDLLTLLAAKKLEVYSDRITEYFEMMTAQNFLPNSPTMMNAGGRLGQLSACFVLGMNDGMEEIMKSTSDAALIFKSGGGVGINYSDLREEGAIVASTSGVASGPVSFMNIINTVTEVVKQGGKRRGANMGIIEAWHPDVEKFITNKTEPGILENFNVSVGIWEDFWNALVNSEDGNYILRSPKDRKPVKEINAHQLIDLIALSAWKSAEPGLIFFDQINKYNVFAKARQAPLRATNPCGEQSLYPYESCNLGSINLVNYAQKQADGSYEFDWQGYEEIIRKTTRFLDNIIDVNHYPVQEINVASKDSRRIGLGVMGVADLLYKLKIPYNSKEGYELQSKLSEALSYYSMEESVALANSRGEFPLCSKTEYPEGKIPISGYYEKSKDKHSFEWGPLIEKIKTHGIRNVLTTTVAPTGTLSMIADCSNGMEPAFALVFEKRVTVGRFFYTNKILEEALRDEGLYSDEILEKIADNYGSLSGIDEIPKWMQEVFVTAMDIHWADHLMAQSVWQDWIGNAIAKTINMPYDVTVEDVKSSYLLAHELGLKGMTVYRDGSRHKQVLHMTSDNAAKTFEVTPSEYMLSYIHENVTNKYIKTQVGASLALKIHDEDIKLEAPKQEEVSEDRLCPTCKNNLVFVEGCSICIECGYSGCTSG
ncbi:adenosylcobalamin-dependent ribonucleoside-diphosphate reductase [Nitrosopumilus sp.]|nr:adenosylcobalamin-dependent ribonucleoside-diphosphate reductase [Nitrosopumilus sp.]